MADEPHRLSRRRLLRAGGTGAAGLTFLGATGLTGRRAAAARAASEDRPNIVLVVVDGVRADFIGAYDDSDHLADTPNLDSLAKDSLRFQHAVPECMPGYPVRRGIVSGVRSYPFRDWTKTEGMADYPGWSPIRDYQPLLTRVLTDSGIPALWLSDNPLLEGDRFKGVYRRVSGSDSLTQIQRFVAPAIPGGGRVTGPPPVARFVSAGIKAIDELKAKRPFFLAIDAFDRREASNPVPLYLRSPERSNEQTGAGELANSAPATYRPDEQVGDKVDTNDVRSHYADELKKVDAEIGKLLDKLDSEQLLDKTVVYFVSASSLSLGEHGVFGTGPAAGHEDAYQVGYMIRDPSGRRSGEPSQYRASTHDVATTVLSYLGIRAPGRMEGEDLTALLDNEPPPDRPYWTTMANDKVMAGDGRYILVSNVEGQEQRIFDTDPDQWHDDHSGDDDYLARDEDRDVSREEAATAKVLYADALTAAGGTLPRFGPVSPIRPNPEIRADNNPTDEGKLDRDDDLNFSGQ